MDSIRVMMTESRELASGGGKMQLGAGSFYLLPEETAEALMAEETAYPEGDLPQASDGTVFEGAGAHRRLADHEAALAAAAEQEASQLSSIDFASDAARELAAENDLGADDFDFEPSGATGFTVADVRRLVGGEES